MLQLEKEFKKRVLLMSKKVISLEDEIKLLKTRVRKLEYKCTMNYKVTQHLWAKIQEMEKKTQ